MKFKDIVEAIEYGVDANGKTTAFGIKDNPNVKSKKIITSYENLPAGKKAIAKAVVKYLKEKGKADKIKRFDLSSIDVIEKADGSMDVTLDTGEKIKISKTEMEKYY